MPAGNDADAQDSVIAETSAPEAGVIVTVAVPLPLVESASVEGLIDNANPPSFVSDTAEDAEPM